MNAERFSSNNGRWPLMAVLTWITSRSAKLTEHLAFSDPVEADRFLFAHKQQYGAPFQVSYSGAFDQLNEKIDHAAIVGVGNKVEWLVLAEQAQLSPSDCYSLGIVLQILGSSLFHPGELLNTDFGTARKLTLRDFEFHDGDCFTGCGVGSANPDGSRIRWTWQAQRSVAKTSCEFGRTFPSLPHGSRRKLTLGNHRTTSQST
jgi:hypothetical protein